jgi:NAD(P)-dependent dehydrogenase (short-subunit alcohol dehydrogenase family)
MAVAYAQEGARVVSVARNASELEETEKIIEARGGEVLTLSANLSSIVEINRLKEYVIETQGGLDVLVNNAATSPWKTVDKMTVEEWDYTIAVNLRAPFLLVKGFMISMTKRGGGSIINITSRSAEMGFVAETAYCPSKYGLEGLTQCLALELGPLNIAVNSLNVSVPEGMRLKPTSLTLEEAKMMPCEQKGFYADVNSMVRAFSEAWVFLAIQNGSGITGQRLSTKGLAEKLSRLGWETVCEHHRSRLTRAVYESYDFPKKVRYQTPGGGWRELNFEGPEKSP